MDVTMKTEDERLFKVTFFVTKGTIQIQRNQKKSLPRKFFLNDKLGRRNTTPKGESWWYSCRPVSVDYR
jgi:hypothetical protein